jgi:hypothetical protein
MNLSLVRYGGSNSSPKIIFLSSDVKAKKLKETHFFLFEDYTNRIFFKILVLQSLQIKKSRKTIDKTIILIKDP